MQIPESEASHSSTIPDLQLNAGAIEVFREKVMHVVVYDLFYPDLADQFVQEGYAHTALPIPSYNGVLNHVIYNKKGVIVIEGNDELLQILTQIISLPDNVNGSFRTVYGFHNLEEALTYDGCEIEEESPIDCLIFNRTNFVHPTLNTPQAIEAFTHIWNLQGYNHLWTKPAQRYVQEDSGRVILLSTLQ